MFKINSACQNYFMFMALNEQKNYELMGLQSSLNLTVCFFQVERNKTIILKIYCSFHGITIVKGNISNLFYS